VLAASRRRKLFHDGVANQKMLSQTPRHASV